MIPATPAIPTNSSAPAEMKVVLAYENVAAAVWAMESLRGLLQTTEHMRSHLSPWNFSILQRGPGADTAAKEADLIVISAAGNDERALPRGVERWLGKCLAHRRNSKTAIAALLGEPTNPDRAESPRLQRLQQLAHDAGCEFFAPSVTDTMLSVA